MYICFQAELRRRISGSDFIPPSTRRTLARLFRGDTDSGGSRRINVVKFYGRLVGGNRSRCKKKTDRSQHVTPMKHRRGVSRSGGTLSRAPVRVYARVWEVAGAIVAAAKVEKENGREGGMEELCPKTFVSVCRTSEIVRSLLHVSHLQRGHRAI
jgi:hypothetical protein